MKTFEEIREGHLAEEEKKGLAGKSEKSGIPVGILRSVYNRGMAAWKTGHRKGTTPQQWAMARVNSATPSKPWACVKKKDSGKKKKRGQK